MNKKREEKKVIRKIQKLYDLDAETIQTLFGDINYKIDEDSLLHLCIKHMEYKFRIDHIINSLINLGLDPNIPDKNGRTFLQAAVDHNRIDCVIEYLYYLDDKYLKLINFENYDKFGNNLFTSLIKNEKLIPILTPYGLPPKSDIAIKKIIDHSSQNIIFNTNNDNELKESRKTAEQYINNKYNLYNENIMHASNSAYAQIQSIYYQKNISLVNKKLVNNLVNYNKDRVAEMFCNQLETLEDYNKLDPIYCCIENCDFDDDISKAIQRYMDMGFTMRFKYGSYNYLELAIDCSYTVQHFCSLLSLFIKNGFNINDNFSCSWNNLFTKIVDKWNFHDIVELYIFLCQNECSHLHRTMIDKDFYRDVRVASFIRLLNNVLSNNSLKIDNNLLKDKNKIEDFLEILDAYYHLLGCVNDYEITNLVIEKILDERQNRIDNTDTIVTEKEVLSALQKVTIDINNNKFNKILLKTK